MPSSLEFLTFEIELRDIEKLLEFFSMRNTTFCIFRILEYYNFGINITLYYTRVYNVLTESISEVVRINF